MTTIEKDATSLGTVSPVMSPELIQQVSDDVPSHVITYQEAIREALREEMERDDSVFLLGEDIGKHGGAFGVTRTLLDQFGAKRVRNTPISENTIVGTATGAALVGMRPVAEIMFVDFSGLALDQIANQAAKLRLMTGGQCSVPWVLRMPQGGGAGKSTAAQHSQSLEVWYAHIPGLKVVLPSTPYDAKGLLKAAIRDDNPVIFLEQKFLYSFRGSVPDEDYVVPLSECDVKRSGSDVTVVASGYMVWHAMVAAEILSGEGFDVEVIDIRTVSPLDEETIGASVRKTGRAVLVAEACRSYGPTGEWGMVVMEHAFDFLQAPIVRVAGRDTPIPFANSIEAGVWPDSNDIVRAVREVMV
ncbi:MAG: alpha-ketoacid dehydrogenase subunit beta [Acidimicrobiia bacterium]|nr:MAG: alpha-ketoacid dehydrogenase subunit beta [Acidimicrobiia bacterium]